MLHFTIVSPTHVPIPGGEDESQEFGSLGQFRSVFRIEAFGLKTAQAQNPALSIQSQGLCGFSHRFGYLEASGLGTRVVASGASQRRLGRSSDRLVGLN